MLRYGNFHEFTAENPYSYQDKEAVVPDNAPVFAVPIKEDKVSILKLEKQKVKTAVAESG